MKLTIAKRLVPIVAAAIIGVTLMAGISQYMTEKVYSNTNYANINVIPSLLLLDDMRKNYLHTRVVAYHLFYSTTEAQKIEQESRINTYHQNVEDAFNKYEFNGCFGISCFADEKDKNLLIIKGQNEILINQINIEKTNVQDNL